MLCAVFTHASLLSQDPILPAVIGNVFRYTGQLVKGNRCIKLVMWISQSTCHYWWCHTSRASIYTNEVGVF